jgi:MFS family permease
MLGVLKKSTVAESRDDAPRGPWSPLRHRVFRSLWIAAVASHIGTWMHDVGAGWMMTELSPSPFMVALVQAAGTLPVFLLALPAGALADIVDRRRLLLWTTFALIAVATTLAMLTWLGAVDARLLLLFTFLLGVGAALTAPAWQSITPDVVPRDELAAASALSSAGVNVSRAIGPALGGLIVSAAGPAAVFALNAVSFLGIVAVLLRWTPVERQRTLPPEAVLGAMLAGARYVRHAPPVRAALVRNAAFVLGASAVWSLLPVVVRGELGLGPTAYGILLACIGVGAVCGAAFLPRLRAALGVDGLVVGATLLFAGVAATLAVAPPFSVLAVAMALGGVAWVACITSFTVAVQVSVPAWVRARALAFHLVVFFGAMTLGAAVWGRLASAETPATALTAAAALMALGTLLTPFFRLVGDAAANLAPALHWPAPIGPPAEEDDLGPVVVLIEYRVPADAADAFVDAMLPMRRIRLRDGATSWTLVRDLADRELFIESFTVGSWLEHLRQHERITEADRLVQDRSRALLAPGTTPAVRHLAARR